MSWPSRLIDSHQHIFWQGRDDAGLIADMDEHGIEQAWLLSWEIPTFEDAPNYHGVLNPLHLRGDGTHAGIPLSDLLKARDHYPDRFLIGYCPHPALGDAPNLLRAAHKIHGARICGEWKFRIPFDDPRSLEVFHFAGDLKLPVVLHIDVPYLQIAGKRTYQPSWYGGTIENLERALLACRDTIFIGHAPGFWREVSGDADTQADNYPAGPIQPGGKLYRLFDEYSNLYADLSANSALKALQRDADHAAQFLNRYAHRLLFGRDCYGGELVEFLRSLDLPYATMEKICFQNAARLLDAP